MSAKTFITESPLTADDLECLHGLSTNGLRKQDIYIGGERLQLIYPVREYGIAPHAKLAQRLCSITDTEIVMVDTIRWEQEEHLVLFRNVMVFKRHADKWHVWGKKLLSKRAHDTTDDAIATESLDIFRNYLGITKLIG